jgi:hypothetical protein
MNYDYFFPSLSSSFYITILFHLTQSTPHIPRWYGVIRQTVNRLTNHQLIGFIGDSLVAETSTGCILGGSALGRRQLKAEQVGERAAGELLQSINTGACVDSYFQDQVILHFFPSDTTWHHGVVISKLDFSLGGS